MNPINVTLNDVNYTLTPIRPSSVGYWWLLTTSMDEDIETAMERARGTNRGAGPSGDSAEWKAYDALAHGVYSFDSYRTALKTAFPDGKIGSVTTSIPGMRLEVRGGRMASPPAPQVARSTRRTRRKTYIARLHSPVHLGEETRYVCALAYSIEDAGDMIENSMFSLGLQHAVGHTPFDEVEITLLRTWLKNQGYKTMWDYLDNHPKPEFDEQIVRLRAD